MPEGVGIGFDVHARDAARPLWLGGLLFEGEPGLEGHSDGDVVCHALADAFLGACALGDVGQHFPDDAAGTEGISGTTVLEGAIGLVERRDRTPISFDVTVLCERPAVAPRREEMRERLAQIVGVPVDRASVKGTRPEGLGLTGDGIGCFAIALLG